jgi:glucosyl-dolichyl phosphate glucuronosyltransferase
MQIVTNKPLFSVIVCTYNHAELLENCLQSLIDQNLDKKLYEVIVVNNNSTDKTQEIAESFCEKEPNFIVVKEINQGLSYARNRGWKEAKGEYVAYIDDDAKASFDWLKVAFDLISTLTPTPLCLGGPILPFYATPKPSWFKDEYEIRSWGQNSRWLSQGESFSGSNMIWKKEVFITFGGFPTDRGVQGNRLSFGEETYLFNKIWHDRKNSDIFYYTTNLVVFHLVPQFKMKLFYPIKRSFAWGNETGRFNQHETFRKVIVSLIKSTYLLLYIFLKSVRRLNKYERFQHWFIEEGKKWASQAGKITALLGLKIALKQN